MRWFGGILVRIVLMDDSWWGTRSSDDIVTFRGGHTTVVVPVRCQEGFERRVLDDVKTVFATGSPMMRTFD